MWRRDEELFLRHSDCTRHNYSCFLQACASSSWEYSWYWVCPTALKESIAPVSFARVNHAQSQFVVSNLPYLLRCFSKHLTAWNTSETYDAWMKYSLISELFIVRKWHTKNSLDSIYWNSSIFVTLFELGAWEQVLWLDVYREWHI